MNQGRDLKFTTDFRSVLGEVLPMHLGSKDLQDVFPGFDNNDNNPETFSRLLRA